MSSSSPRRAGADGDSTQHYQSYQPQGPHVQEQPPMDVASEDSFDDDELGLRDVDGQSSEYMSIWSSILEHEYENGRRYHHYRHGRYPLPNDDKEQRREAIKHAIHLESSNGDLINAPIGDHPQKILDLCTGTGLWAIEIADRYPSAQVIGIDFSPIQPRWAPINVRFMIDDVEDDWVESDMYNLIHMRHSCSYLSNIEDFLQKCYDHLVPGGWCEFSDFGGRALCDDGTMPDDYPVNEAMALWHTIMAQTGSNTLIVNEHETNFKNAGFTGVRCRIIKTPIGAWPKDKTQRLIGMYFQEVVHELIKALADKPFRSVMSEPELGVFLSKVRQALNDDSIHSYFNFVIWWGQRPPYS